ncbi:MAG TPA: hypothetical protein VL993_10050 [Stellaceae bacterium]|nr:hypothetical protein [Stellaceae bacterium]
MPTLPLAADVDAAPRARRTGRVTRVATAVAMFSLLSMPDRPEVVIGSELAAGATALNALPPDASRETVRKTLESLFPNRAVSVDPGSFPVAVAVTLKNIDRATCVSAEHSARRIEGKVVVELKGYASPAACGSANDMTWRLML